MSPPTRDKCWCYEEREPCEFHKGYEAGLTEGITRLRAILDQDQETNQ